MNKFFLADYLLAYRKKKWRLSSKNVNNSIRTVQPLKGFGGSHQSTYKPKSYFGFCRAKATTANSGLFAYLH
jgi:hypothetical protein